MAAGAVSLQVTWPLCSGVGRSWSLDSFESPAVLCIGCQDILCQPTGSVLDLVARDAPPTGGLVTAATRMTVPVYAWQPQQYPIFPLGLKEEKSTAHAGELRVVGGLTLPCGLADRPWITCLEIFYQVLLGSRRAFDVVDIISRQPARSPPRSQTLISLPATG
jgi:hypothetical protein